MISHTPLFIFRISVLPFTVQLISSHSLKVLVIIRHGLIPIETSRLEPDLVLIWQRYTSLVDYTNSSRSDPERAVQLLVFASQQGVYDRVPRDWDNRVGR